MQNFKIVLLSFKAHYEQIHGDCKFFLLILLLTLIFFNLSNEKYYNDGMIIFFIRQEFYINFIFLTSILMASIVSLTNNINNCFILLLNKNYRVREIFIGKLIAVYLFVSIAGAGLYFIASRKENFIDVILKFPMMLPALMIVIFFHCTVIVLTTSLKSKKTFWFFILFLTIYVAYSSIPLLNIEPSKSLIHYIIFDDFLNFKINLWLKIIYLSLHIFLSILLIYFAPLLIKNK